MSTYDRTIWDSDPFKRYSGSPRAVRVAWYIALVYMMSMICVACFACVRMIILQFSGIAECVNNNCGLALPPVVGYIVSGIMILGMVPFGWAHFKVNAYHDQEFWKWHERLWKL